MRVKGMTTTSMAIASAETQLGILVSRLLNSYTVVASATAPDSRSDEGAMLFHCDRGATTKTGPFRPTRRADGGCGRSRRRDSSAMKEHLPPHRSSTSPRKHHRQRYSYLGDGTLALLHCIPWRCSFPILPRISAGPRIPSTYCTSD